MVQQAVGALTIIYIARNCANPILDISEAIASGPDALAAADADAPSRLRIPLVIERAFPVQPPVGAEVFLDHGNYFLRGRP
jgi:hypothetical protein